MHGLFRKQSEHSMLVLSVLRVHCLSTMYAGRFRQCDHRHVCRLTSTRPGVVFWAAGLLLQRRSQQACLHVLDGHLAPLVEWCLQLLHGPCFFSQRKKERERERNKIICSKFHVVSCNGADVLRVIPCAATSAESVRSDEGALKDDVIQIPAWP